MLFPGQTSVTASGGLSGVLTQEAPADNATTVTYTFVAANPDVYLLQRTHMEMEAEMGPIRGPHREAYGVRPERFDPNRRAYNTPASQYDR